MKRGFILLILCICSIQPFYSQEDDGVVSLTIPSRNSLTFNRFAMNPTFSFVREQTKYISFYNKRQWVQFDNSPTTYLASYSGRFSENIGAGLGVFQQDYGVLTTFGGLLNFAYNARLGSDSNLTFGLNIGAYKSGINTASVVTNFDDPSLQNVPENFLMTVSPGINYGLEFLDIGVSVNNLVLYNFESSALIEDNQEQSIEAYLMYTGYMDSKGFFDDSKFTGLLMSEFHENRTNISAKAMITVPKGIWAQIGYNPIYGASGGIGFNITKNIALEYNFERSLGDLNSLGHSHDITLAYRFKNNKYYDYSRQDEVNSIFNSGKKKNKKSKTKVANKKNAEVAKAKAKVEADKQAKIIAEQKAQEEANKAKAELLEKQKIEKEAEAQLLETQKAQAIKDKIEADKKVDEEAQAKLIKTQKAKEQRDKQAQLLAKEKAKEEALVLAKQKKEREAQAKIAEAKIQAELIAKQKEDEEKVKLLKEQEALKEAEAKAKFLEAQKVLKERKEQTKSTDSITEYNAKMRAESIENLEKQAKIVEEQKAIEETIENPTDDFAKSMKTAAKSTKENEVAQKELLRQLDDLVAIKDKDLIDLKEENDLSDKGIAVKPRPFKSVTAQNNKLNTIKSELENVITTQSNKIEELNTLYEARLENKTFAMDEVTLYYKKEIERLKSEQIKTTQAKALLDTKLETIKVGEEFEKRRRIKRADFNNEDDRYNQDRATLQNIKKTTSVSKTSLKEEDFDFGEAQGNSIQILKNIKNIESGYYLIIAVHSNTKSRNEFVTNVVASGRSDVDFFYDVKTSKYYIYYDKFKDISKANKALTLKGNKPYNGKMSIVKIEN